MYVPPDRRSLLLCGAVGRDHPIYHYIRRQVIDAAHRVTGWSPRLGALDVIVASAWQWMPKNFREAIGIRPPPLDILESHIAQLLSPRLRAGSAGASLALSTGCRRSTQQRETSSSSAPECGGAMWELPQRDPLHPSDADAIERLHPADARTTKSQ